MNSKRSCCLSSISLFTPLNGKSAVLIASTAFLAATSGLMAETQRPGAQPDAWRNTPSGKATIPKSGSVQAPEGPGPLNDNCAAASPILIGNTAFDNTGATTDGPAHASCLFFGDDQVGSDIWYDFTATESNTLIVSLCGSLYDTKVAIYNGCGCPATDGNLLACNDDFCGLQSFATTPVIQGQCYKIRVGGFAGAMGSGNISLSFPAPLTNDNCIDRLDVFDGVTQFDTTAATTDGPAHAACSFFGDDQVGSDIWFNYTASQTGFLRLETCGSAYDTKLAAYGGHTCPVSDANLIACNDDACGLQSRVQFDVIQGDLIKIRVGGFAGATGPGQLSISYVVNPCPNPEHSCDQTGTPGCSDAECCNTICAIDPFCCEVAWDGICVDEFFTFCFDCVVTCPPDGVQEVEPCGQDMNGGCNDPNLACQNIACNDTVCGTHWSSPELRDTDWYCFTITQPNTAVTWSVTSEFSPIVFIISLQCTVIAQSTGQCPHEAAAVLGPGTYFAVVAPSAFVDLPCGGADNDYTGTLTANCAPPCRGDINEDGTVDMDDLLLLLRDWGPCDP